MADTKVVKYIKDNLKKGFSKEEIRNALLKARYKQEIVDEAFENLKPVAKPKLSVIIILAIILLFGLLWYKYNYVNGDRYDYMLLGQKICGLKIAEFASDSPLSGAGISKGDIILSINGVDIMFSYEQNATKSELVRKLITLNNPAAIKTDKGSYSIDLPNSRLGIWSEDVNCTFSP